MDDLAIEVKDLSFRYRQTTHAALSHVSFSVPQGSFFCIIGGNGVGKSTLCNTFVGLIPHYFLGKMDGDVRVNGQSIRDQSIADLSSQIGLVFQNPFNQLSYTASTVAEELAYGLGNRGVAREEMVKKVKAVAKLMRIDQVLDQNPLDLSGGQAQRVAFGSTFILEPKILVLDECTTQLDPMGADEIFAIVKRLNNEGITVVMVDHDMERVAEYADQVLVLADGSPVCQGTPAEVFGDPRLAEWGVEPPDYAAVTQALARRQLIKDKLGVTKDQAAALVKEGLNHAD